MLTFREWQVLDLARKELRPEAELPWPGNPAKVGGANTILGE